VRQVSGAVLKKPFALNGMATGWVGETDARPQTAAPQLAELQFPTMELYAMPAATASLIEDSAVDIEGWIASEVEAAFAEQEGAAFVAGDGLNKPRGFLDYPSVADDTWSWGNLGFVATGAAGAFGTDPSDRLVELIYALKAGHRQNGRFVMNRKTQALIRKFKDADGNYLWMPPAGAGQAASLMGFPVVEAEDMPDVAANALALAFGDFRRGYLVVDRTGRAHPARSLFCQALRAVLHHQARRRRGAEFRGDQASEIRRLTDLQVLPANPSPGLRGRDLTPRHDPARRQP
jgi:HK97 family phage major capsid protein